MGIENRDYLGDSYSSYGGSGSFLRTQSGDGQIWKKIIIVTVAVFILEILTVYTPSVSGLRAQHPQLEDQPDARVQAIANESKMSRVENWLELSPENALNKGQLWRLATYALCHDRSSPFHILFNMLFVWWFGKAIEQMYGSREFLYFYITSAVIAGLAFVGIAVATGDPTPSVGASGAIMAFLMLYTMHFPRQKIYIWGIIPLELRWLMTLYVIFDLYPVLNSLASGRSTDGIAHSAHLGGLAFGYLYYRNDWRISNWFSGLSNLKWKRRRTPKGVRLHQPVSEPARPVKNEREWEQDVDRILAKIHDQGESSLTAQERSVLKKASERYKNNS